MSSLRVSRRAVWFVGCALVAVLASGCSAGKDRSAPTSTSTSRPAATTAPLAPAAAICNGDNEANEDDDSAVRALLQRTQLPPGTWTTVGDRPVRGHSRPTSSCSCPSALRRPLRRRLQRTTRPETAMPAPRSRAPGASNSMTASRSTRAARTWMRSEPSSPGRRRRPAMRRRCGGPPPSGGHGDRRQRSQLRRAAHRRRPWPGFPRHARLRRRSRVRRRFEHQLHENGRGGRARRSPCG